MISGRCNAMDNNTRMILKVMIIIKGVIALVCLILFVLTFAGNYLFLALFHGVWCLIDRSVLRSDNPYRSRSVRTALCVYCILVFITVFIPGMMTFPIKTIFPWQYRFQMIYIMKDGQPPKYFPEQIPVSATDYELEFLPTVMQGDGHLNVAFRDAGYVAKVRPQIEEFTIKTYVMSEYPEFAISMYDDDCPIDIPRDVRKEHPDATIFFLSSNHYGNHPRGTAVIIDSDYIMYINM